MSHRMPEEKSAGLEITPVDHGGFVILPSRLHDGYVRLPLAAFSNAAETAEYVRKLLVRYEGGLTNG